MNRLFSHSAWIQRALIVVISFSVALFATSAISSVSFAQEDKGGEAAKADEGGEEGKEGGAAGGDGTNALVWLMKAMGWRYVPTFLIMSFILVALVVMNLLSARRDSMCPASLIEGFEAKLNEKQYQEAYELAKADESFLGNVLSAGLAKLQDGYDHAIEAMQEVGEEENMKLEHRMSYVNLIAQIAPMVGLLGTVDGMIASFYEIATGGQTPDPNKLAEGISTALVTTLVGLVIAIPAIMAYRMLRNRFQRLVLEVGIVSEGLMSRFQSGSKK